ncbi:unnamed protein product [Hydatigera taeniaeformis]|uniref:Secreted protein n=1 Tax=Hydatigena taeniaeformis TaxID=6205 RepID=A0A0R3WTC4_HYDTA|nr:unnamed protein product [Hydatigera taeniaeformis]
MFDVCGFSTVNAFTLGFTSRCLVGALLLPFTVVKAQAEAGLTGGRSTFSSIRWLYTTAKWRGIYSGLLPTLARDSPYSGIYLLFYTQFKNLIFPSDTIDTTVPAHILSVCALLAAMCATAVTQPADVLRSNRQLSIVTIPLLKADSNNQRKANTVDQLLTSKVKDNLENLPCDF